MRTFERSKTLKKIFTVIFIIKTMMALSKSFGNYIYMKLGSNMCCLTKDCSRPWLVLILLVKLLFYTCKTTFFCKTSIVVLFPSEFICIILLCEHYFCTHISDEHKHNANDLRWILMDYAFILALVAITI